MRGEREGGSAGGKRSWKVLCVISSSPQPVSLLLPDPQLVRRKSGKRHKLEPVLVRPLPRPPRARLFSFPAVLFAAQDSHFLPLSLPPSLPSPEPESPLCFRSFCRCFRGGRTLETADWIWKKIVTRAHSCICPFHLCTRTRVSLSLTPRVRREGATWKGHRRQTIPASDFKTLWRRKRSDLVCPLSP